MTAECVAATNAAPARAQHTPSSLNGRGDRKTEKRLSHVLRGGLRRPGSREGRIVRALVFIVAIGPPKRFRRLEILLGSKLQTAPAKRARIVLACRANRRRDTFYSTGSGADAVFLPIEQPIFLRKFCQARLRGTWRDDLVGSLRRRFPLPVVVPEQIRVWRKHQVPLELGVRIGRGGRSRQGDRRSKKESRFGDGSKPRDGHDIQLSPLRSPIHRTAAGPDEQKREAPAYRYAELKGGASPTGKRLPHRQNRLTPA